MAAAFGADGKYRSAQCFQCLEALPRGQGKVVKGIDLARQRFEHDRNVSLGLPGEPLASKECIAEGDGLLGACFR